jgi:hypothetical protein
MADWFSAGVGAGLFLFLRNSGKIASRTLLEWP